MYSDFFASLHTAWSKRRIARLFAGPVWTVRKCGWTDYELTSPFAELVIEAESPTLFNGSVLDAEANIDQILMLLRDTKIAQSAECYDSEGEADPRAALGDDVTLTDSRLGARVPRD